MAGTIVSQLTLGCSAPVRAQQPSHRQGVTQINSFQGLHRQVLFGQQVLSLASLKSSVAAQAAPRR